MRLETDHDGTTAVEGAVVDSVVANYDRQANEALRDGIQAAQAGDRARARTALLRATELDPTSESAWLWLASISDYPEELLVFLNNVLEINPHNGRALEWMSATKSLLAKTFVQRGVEAAGGGQADLAAQCFNQALENDQSNADAWLWLAKLAESPEGKLSYLEKVLEIDPSNEEASAEYAAAQNAINQSLLAEARSAAVSGRKGDANDLLDAFIAVNPESEDGWILRGHLADGFEEKIAAFEKVLSINPANSAAASGIESLRSIMSLAFPVAPAAEPAAEPQQMENTAYVLESQRESDAEEVHPKYPTQDLEFPPAAFPLHERETGSSYVEAEKVDTVDAPSEGQSDWNMNTVAFSFSFPAGQQEESSVTPPTEIAADDAFEFTAADAAASDDHLYERSDLISPSEPEAAEAPEGVAELSYGQAEAAQFAPAITEEFSVNEVSTVEAFPEPIEDAEDSFEEVSIPMPADFSVSDVVAQTGFETRIVRDAPAHQVACPFCKMDNPAQSFTCVHCLATLTLSDLEMLLANTHADKALLRAAIKEFEEMRELRPVSESELTNCGVAYLNLRDFDSGVRYLQEAAQLNPNNFVLASQINSLLIRLGEIRKQEEAAQSMPKEKKILVVDDSATVRKLIAGKLEKCGHQVFCAADGVEAIEQLDLVVPDLILLDITMPRMDGYQVCKVIRGKDTTKNVPVVMISGKDGFFDKVRGRMAGTTGYITKPFGPETLMKAVETYLSGAPVAD